MESGLTTPDDQSLAYRLLTAANELMRAADELKRSEPPREGQFPSPIMLGGAAREAGCLDLARKIYRDRRRREEIFADANLFGEPAWDILLDLFIAAKENKRISITSACIGSCAPSTTALRWLNILERRGLIEREGDALDMRRSYVRLTGAATALMDDYLVRIGLDGAQIDDGAGGPLRNNAVGAADARVAGRERRAHSN